MKLNTNWLRSAVVFDGNGNRFGTVGEVGNDGDALTVLQRGKPHVFSAAKLEKQGRIDKPNATDSKWV